MSAQDMEDAIRQAVARIPKGKVAAYGDVARRAGFPGRARFVGRVLRNAPANSRLPWHRVSRADGRIAFPAGSDAYVRQLRQLEKEGVILEGGRIPRRFYVAGETDLDAALWGPD